MGIMNKILLIEDDMSINKILAYELKKKGYSIDKKIINAENLNTLGTHIVKINLHKQVTAELNVVLKDGE